MLGCDLEKVNLMLETSIPETEMNKSSISNQQGKPECLETYHSKLYPALYKG